MSKKFFALLLLFLGSFAFADDPASVNTFVTVILGLLQGKVGYIFIAIVLGFSGFFAWRNGNITPLIWGVIAALIIGAAPYVGPQILSWGNSTFNG